MIKFTTLKYGLFFIFAEQISGQLDRIWVFCAILLFVLIVLGINTTGHRLLEK